MRGESPALSDDVVRLSVIGQIIRRRWRLLAVLAAVGALLGAGASLLFSPGYVSTSSVLLQGPRDDGVLLTETQIATSSVVLDRTAASLGWDVTGSELQGSVSAEVADGNVIEIRGSAGSPDRAQQLTDRVTQEYMTFSTQLVSSPSDASAQVLKEQQESLRQQVEATNQRITELHGSANRGAVTVESVQARAELVSLRTTLADAITRLDDAEGAFRGASIVIMEPAELPLSPAEPTLAQFSVASTLLFFVLGVLAHLVAARADRRLRSAAEIASALDAPVVGSVDVPDAVDAPPATDEPGGPRRWCTRLWRLVRDDQPWDTPQFPVSSNDIARTVRYQRVLALLRDTDETALRLVVLAADDDATAHRAVAQLAEAAGADGGHPTVLRVARVCAARPTVPDYGSVSGVLVVVTAGTRTAWELVGIAEACADAGHQIVGALVTQRIRPIEDQPFEPTRMDSPNGKAMAGSV